MRGLEIGALATPRVGKDEGPIRYLDHATTDELKQKYATNPGMRSRLNKIVAVDYVIREGRTIADTVGGDAPFDYVVASHVIEHIPDPVGWMAEVACVLRPDGILSLIIPDKRYSFDINRALTDISDLVDANLRSLRQPSYRQAYDFYARAIAGMVDADSLWVGVADYGTTVPQNVDDPDVAALEACRRMQTSDEFVDVHCQVFTPDSFLLLFEKLARLDLIDFELASFFPTEIGSHEFTVGLRLLDAAGDRAEMRARQLRSLSLVRDKTSDPEGASAAKVELVGLVVSPLEKRAIMLKRDALARVRATLKRVRAAARKH
jgi:SAM-dependent methyltransferase